MNDCVALPRFALVIVLTMAAMFFTGCAATRSMSTAGNSAPAMLSADHASLNFGSVLVGAKTSLPLVVTNAAGSGPTVTISRLAVSSAFTFSGPALPFTMAPGQSTTVVVTFVPKAAGTASGTLSIVSDAANATLSVSLSGSGAKSAQLSVVPAALSFGKVSLGKRQTLTANLKTNGAAVTVSSASWNGSGFAVSGITFPATVGPNQQLPFNVTFAPQSVGSAAGTISFVNNTSSSPATMQLSGTGVQHSVTLNWNPSTSSVQGYYVYRGGVSGGPYSRLSTLDASLFYTDANVASGKTYYYVVTALGTDGVESGYSNQVTANIP